MEVIWSNFAKVCLKEIYLFHKEKANEKVAKNIKDVVLSSTKQLIAHPKSGEIEENLKILNQNHRYLVVSHFKIIYRPVAEGILISDVFDCRQDPSKMNKNNQNQIHN